MKLRRSMIVLSLVWASVSALAQSSASGQIDTVLASNGIQPGVVVEEVTNNSAAEKAGILPGDLLLAWSNSSTGNGAIESPFDVDQIRIEWAPRGVVIIQGRRGREERSWTISQGNWGLVTRLNFSETALSAYQRGQEFAKANKPKDAARVWNEGASQFGEQSSIARFWLVFRIAETFAAAKQWQDADAGYKAVLDRLSGASRAPITAQVLQAWALAYRKRNDWTNAEARYQQAITEVRAFAPGSLMQAFLLNELGNVSDHRGDLAKAEDCYQQALAIREKLAPGSLDFASTLNNLGVVAWRRSDLALAEDRYQMALKIRQRLAPDSLELAGSLSDLGIVAAQRGELAKADEYCSQALEIREKLSPDTLDVAMSLVNLAGVVQYRGDLVRSEAYYRRALSIEERLAPAGTYYVPGTLTGLSLIADLRGDLARAEQYLKKALELQEKLTPHTLAVAADLNDLGAIVEKRGNLAQAEEYLQQALKLRQELSPESIDVAETLNLLGTVALARGEVAKAEDYCGQALGINRRLVLRSLATADVLSNLGDAALQRGNLDKAEAHYREALEIRESLAPGSTDHAEALAAIARILVQRQQLQGAASMFEKALNALESQTARLGGSAESRTGFRAKHAGYYKDYIDLLITLKRPELAFQVVERSRARTLLEILAEAHTNIQRGGDATLLARERLLRESLNAKSNSRIEVLSGRHTEAQAAAINQEIENLVAQYQDVQAQLRSTSPGYADLTQPQLVSTKDVQERLLDDDTVLLEYCLDERRSHVWALTRDSMAHYELPPRAVIERAARQVYMLLTARNQTIDQQNELQKRSRLDRAAREYESAASALSQMILGPVAAQIGKQKRLLVVSEGALQYLPFAALPSPAGTLPKEGSAKGPLLLGHEVVNLPSASVMAALRRAEEGRRKAPKAVAVLADPVFARSDARVKAITGRKTPNRGTTRRTDEENRAVAADASARDVEEPLIRSLVDMDRLRGGGFNLSRLPFSRREAKTILSVTPAGQGMEALDFQASRATATGSQLAEYRMVHFATHGLLDSEHPELSGLVFSLVNSQGEPQNGFLSLEDVYNMSLSAELVVLSACETGLGKEIQGEGLLSLTRGFMYAGAPTVVASLWSVDDEATAELMGRFYRAMQKEGMRPAGALRRAQMEIVHQKRWSEPYYWSGFVIQGEWR